MIWFYRFLFLPVLLLSMPYYLRRMLRRGGYGRNFTQRFGRVDRLPGQLFGVKRIWIQAVSVGEILAIGPLLDRLHKDGAQIYLSTTTSTGYRMAIDRYSHLTIGIGYFPIDFWPFSVRAWRHIQPNLAVLTEGERWPEHIHQAKRRGVPVVCINARMSDRGYRRMSRLPALSRSLFKSIDLFLPCSRQDGERLLQLGFPKERIEVTGNIKLDVSIPPLEPAQRTQLLKELGLGEADFILVGSSTWPGEELALTSALSSLRASGFKAGLLIVPRHAERRNEIGMELRQTPFSTHFRSRGPASGPVDICVGDTTGELRKFLQLADLVFVGKSLAPHHEGQTPVEAAALGKPVLFGPEMSNFRQIAHELREEGAACVVKTSSELSERVAQLASDPSSRQAMAKAAEKWHQANKGALDRTIAALYRRMSQ